jgi:hypothetical protein
MQSPSQDAEHHHTFGHQVATVAATVVCPEHAHEGDTIVVVAPDGTVCNICVPFGAKPYDTFKASLPCRDQNESQLIPTIQAEDPTHAKGLKDCDSWIEGGEVANPGSNQAAPAAPAKSRHRNETFFTHLKAGMTAQMDQLGEQLGAHHGNHGDIPYLFNCNPESLKKWAEKAGWLFKEGNRWPAKFKKRWCLLVLPPTEDGTAINPASQDRWLVYYDDKDSGQPNGVIELPFAGYSIREPQKEREKPYNIRIDVESGRCKGSKFVFAMDTVDHKFSWVQAFANGTNLTSRRIGPSQLQTLREVQALLPTEVGGSGDAVSSDNREDNAMLMRIWEGFCRFTLGPAGTMPAYAAKDNKWKEFGFQRDDPISDLRAYQGSAGRGVRVSDPFGSLAQPPYGTTFP